MRDTIYHSPDRRSDTLDQAAADPEKAGQLGCSLNEPFRFDQRVVSVFEDMINRSVPGYASVIAMCGSLAAKFARAGDQVYDLGASLGAGTFSIAEQLREPVRITAIDSSEPMVLAMRKRLQKSGFANKQHKIRCELEDILTYTYEPCAFVTLNYTLQFTPVNERPNLIAKLYKALKPGGALLISEKIHFEDAKHDQLMRLLHEDFKRRNGYSESEIAGKRRALENVLVTERLSAHVERLRHAGFRSVDVWFQCFNFCSILAIK